MPTQIGMSMVFARQGVSQMFVGIFLSNQEQQINGEDRLTHPERPVNKASVDTQNDNLV